MEILAVYTAPEALETALAAGARHLAATLEGFALIYQLGSDSSEPDGWAGFTCAQDAQVAGEQLDPFRREIERSERAIRGEGPTDPPRIWTRAAGGLYGFPLQHAGKTRGVAIMGCPGPWPRIRNAEVESILCQIALVLDHHMMSEKVPGDTDGSLSDELLRLSEELLARDVELLKKDEHYDRLESVKNSLVEKMAFELRYPLNGIIERVISVLADEHEKLSETSRDALRNALDEGNSLVRMLQNIQDLWRIRNNEMRAELQDVNLAEIVEEAVFNVREKLGANIGLRKQLAPSLPKVRTDLAKLSQILFFLLDNAAKFTRTGHIGLELSVEDNTLTIGVTDTGIGISAGDQTRVFDAFFQVQRSSAGPYRGAGLGLTLARALIEQLGGNLSISSEVGHGSRFNLTIPVSVL